MDIPDRQRFCTARQSDGIARCSTETHWHSCEWNSFAAEEQVWNRNCKVRHGLAKAWHVYESLWQSEAKFGIEQQRKGGARHGRG